MSKNLLDNLVDQGYGDGKTAGGGEQHEVMENAKW